MKKLLALLMILFIGLPAAKAEEFKAGTTYYIDGSEQNGNLLSSGAIIKVLTGSQEVSCTNIGSNHLSFIPSQNCFTVTLRRYNPNNPTEIWNHIDNIPAPPDPANYIYKVDGDLYGGKWVLLAESKVPDAWLISQQINGWDKTSDTEKLTYDFATDVYTITIDASKLKTGDQGDGFKIGYDTAKTTDTNNWSSVVGTNKSAELVNGEPKEATLGGANNFVLPSSANGDVTIVYSHTNNQLTATWGGGGGEVTTDQWTKTQVTASGTLPRMYLTVSEEVMSRNLQDKTYREGTYYLVDKDGTELFGTKDSPFPLEIKARGNYTRTGFSKKPFKLKLGKKQSLLGLSKSKHYALLTHADDERGYLCNYIGFWLGKQIFPEGVFTPQEKPVELYINGYYWGLYFLTESIRVEETRINIAALDDNVSDNTIISGGYVVELDNYPDDGQIVMDEAENSGSLLRITPDTPEIYSDLQRKFVTEQFTTMNYLVGKSSDDLWQYMDLDMAARYYVVMEILCHWEAYHGSTYLYRDRGKGKKWTFSPLWDCGHALEFTEGWLYQHEKYGNTWIKQMLKNQKFSEKVKATYLWFWANKATKLYDDMETYVKYIEEAAKKDHERWGNEPLPDKYNDPLNNYSETNPTAVKDNSDLVSKFAKSYKPNLEDRIKWLNKQWGESTTACKEPEWDETPAAELPYYASPDFDPDVVLIPEDTSGNGVYPVFFEGRDNESKFYAYVYNSSGTTIQPCGSWPGQACERVKINDKWYWYTLINAGEDRDDWCIIFTNNDGWQYPVNNSNTTVKLVKREIYSETGATGSIVEPGPYSQAVVYNNSGELPRLYISTDVAMLDRNLADKDYREGTYYLVDKDGNELLGTEDSPLPLEIKARGNYTRTGFSKKPFKLKLGSKQKMLGLSESKHFALLTHADDKKGYLCNYVGFWLGKHIFPDGSDGVHDKVFTPEEKPVELYLNGKYWGLYFLTESIRIEKTRINIEEGKDEEQNPANISGGYVVELDNYPDKGQIVMDEAGNSGSQLRITPDTPEVYSDLQRKFVTEQFTTMNYLVGEHSDELWKYMDLDMAARYYVVMEIIGHWEAYHGSTYLYRDLGEDKKWTFSPLWDCGHALELTEGWLYERGEYGNTWIKQMLKNQKFSEKVKATYRWFWANKATELYDDMKTYVNYIEKAAKCDHERWGNEPLPDQYNDPLTNNYTTNPTAVSDNSDLVSNFTNSYKPNLEDRIKWLNKQWGESSTDCKEPEWDTTPAAKLPLYATANNAPWLISKELNGWNLNDKETKFEYVKKQKAFVVTVDASKLRSQDSNGFKIGYYPDNTSAVDVNIEWKDVYGASNDDELQKNVAAATLKGTTSKNFIIPDDVRGDVTLTFNMTEGTLTVTWTDPVIYSVTLTLIDLHSSPWEDVHVYAHKDEREPLNSWPGTPMTLKMNAPGISRADAAPNTWTHSFETDIDPATLDFIYSNGSTNREDADEAVQHDNDKVHVRTNDGIFLLDPTLSTVVLPSVGETFNVSVINGMLVVTSDVEMVLPVATVDGRVMMYEISRGITMIRLDHGIYIVNGKKYAL